MKYFLVILGIMLSLNFISFAQDEETETDSIEIFLIDSYVTPEKPNRFVLSFFTDKPCKSKIIIEGKYQFPISEEFTEDHKTSINISDFKFDSSRIPFFLFVEDTLGKTYRSERFDVALPSEFQSSFINSPNIFLMCCVGGVIFGLPSPTYIAWGEKNYFSLTKEIPILSFYTLERQYPLGYISAEYSYIFNGPTKNFFRGGYKHIFELPYIEYVSTGVSMFSNFKGFNGVSPEVTLGWVKFYDVFTIFTKYRYNFKPSAKNSDFHEISIGLYSSFFSLNFNF